MIYGLPETKSELRMFDCGEIQSTYNSLDRTSKANWRRRAAKTGCIRYWISGDTVEIRTYNDLSNDYPITCRWFDNVGSLMDISSSIVTNYLANNSIPAGDLPRLLTSVHTTVCNIHRNIALELVGPTKILSKVQVARSITPDAIISFEDGKAYKTLRRHLSIRDLTPDSYRTKWGLPDDYPMTAKNYSEYRSALARNRGHGKAHSETGPDGIAAEARPKPKRLSRSQKSKAEPKK